MNTVYSTDSVVMQRVQVDSITWEFVMVSISICLLVFQYLIIFISWVQCILLVLFTFVLRMTTRCCDFQWWMLHCFNILRFSQLTHVTLTAIISVCFELFVKKLNGFKHIKYRLNTSKTGWTATNVLQYVQLQCIWQPVCICLQECLKVVPATYRTVTQFQ